jgi:hypothetical protein
VAILTRYSRPTGLVPAASLVAKISVEFGLGIHSYSCDGEAAGRRSQPFLPYARASHSS